MIGYIKNRSNTTINTIESILISYDFQAGNYTKKAIDNPKFETKWADTIHEVIDKHGEFASLMEVGVGEATTFSKVIKRVGLDKCFIGFDISWSRIKYAKAYLKKKNINNADLFVGDLFNIPLADNSIDFVYTSHSLEPNGGREKEALIELYRVTNKYLFLFEPSYEFADEETKLHINKNGYGISH